MAGSQTPASSDDRADAVGVGRPVWFVAGLAAIVVATFVVRAPTFGLPLDQDCSVYSYVASNWSEGGVPYRDVWDHKPPMIYLVYRGLFTVMPSGGEGLNTALRVSGGGCDALTAVLLALVAARLFGRGAGLAAGMLYAVFEGAVGVQLEAFQAERLTVLFTVAGVWAAVAYADSRRYWQVAASGLLFGLAIATKQIAAPVGIAVWAWLTWDAFRAEGRGAVRRVVVHSLLLAVGAVLPWALFAAYFAAQGALADFWACTYSYNVLYAKAHRKGGLVEGVVRLIKTKLFDHLFLWVLAAVGTVAALVRSRERRGGLLVAAWTAVAFLALVLPGQFAYYYYIPTLAPLAVASGVALMGLWTLARGGGVRLAAAGVCGLVLLAMLAFAGKRAAGVHTMVTDPQRTNMVLPQVARHIAESTKPDERFYVWGSRAQLYVLSGRRNVCRYLYNYSYQVALDKAFHFRQAERDETIAALREHRPPCIVTTETKTLEGFPELKQHLAAHYTLERTWEAKPYPLSVYRRTPSQGQE